MSMNQRPAAYTNNESIIDDRSDANLTYDDIQRDLDLPEGLDIIENTPLKRAKEMYQHCIQKAKIKHSSSSSKGVAMSKSDISPSTSSRSLVSNNLPKADSTSDNDCTRIQIDLCDNKAQNSLIVSSKPLRIKLIWVKQDSNDSTSAVGAAERKNTQKVMYERMFKIDTKVRDKEGNIKSGGQIALHFSEMLKSLYNEHISSNSTFDKTAKKIIRSHYKVIFEKQVEKSQINSEENNKSDCKDNPSSTEASPFASDGKYTGSEELNSLICHLQSENEQLQILLAEKDRNLKLLNQKLEKNEYESTHYTNENSELREAINIQNETCKIEIDTLKRDKVKAEDENKQLLLIIKQKDSAFLNQTDEMKRYIELLESKLVKYEKEVKVYQEKIELACKSKLENQLVHIQNLMKEKDISENNLSRISSEFEQVQDSNERLSQKLVLFTEENTKLKQSLSKMRLTKENLEQSISHLDKIDKLTVKIDLLTRENLEKEHQCSLLAKELEKSQEENKACQQAHNEELSNYISKIDHKNAIQKQYQENQIIVKELLQTIKKQKQEEEKVSKLMKSTDSTLTHEQALIISEFAEISERLMQFDDGKVSQNKKTICELLDEILDDYRKLLSKYKIIEAQLIDVKVKYAEAEEVKERLLFEIENRDSFDSKLSRNTTDNRSIMYTEEGNIEKKSLRSLKSNASSGFLSKATNLFNSASSYYSGRFGNNS